MQPPRLRVNQVRERVEDRHPPFAVTSRIVCITYTDSLVDVAMLEASIREVAGT